MKMKSLVAPKPGRRRMIKMDDIVRKKVDSLYGK
jgi:hypothetical protein